MEIWNIFFCTKRNENITWHQPTHHQSYHPAIFLSFYDRYFVKIILSFKIEKYSSANYFQTCLLLVSLCYHSMLIFLKPWIRQESRFKFSLSNVPKKEWPFQGYITEESEDWSWKYFSRANSNNKIKKTQLFLLHLECLLCFP